MTAMRPPGVPATGVSSSSSPSSSSSSSSSSSPSNLWKLLLQLVTFGGIAFLLFSSKNDSALSHITGVQRTGGGNGNGGNNLQKPHDLRMDGILSWEECLRRFPGLVETPPVFVPATFPTLDDGEPQSPPTQASIPVYVIAYNNPTFVKNMVAQVDCYGSHAVVVDSGSTYPPFRKWLDELENPQYTPTSRSGIRHRLIKLEKNAGPRGGAFAPSVFAEMPAFAAITDADIAFNPYLPPNFLEVFANLTQIFKGRKIGFALSLENPERFWPGIYGDGLTLTQFESMWWKNKMQDSRIPTSGSPCITENLYDASIDTTFAVYDVNQVRPVHCGGETCHFFIGVRVGGDCFTADHVPWQINFTRNWDRGEIMAAFGPPAQGSTISGKLREFGILPPL